MRLRARVRAERERRGWSQVALATKLKAKGVRGILGSTVAKIESGDRKVKLDEVMALAEIFGISVDTLLGRKPGVASEIATVFDGLQQASGKAVLDIAAMHSLLQSWFSQLPEVEFDNRNKLESALGEASDALLRAQEKLYEIGQLETPQRFSRKSMDEMIDRKAAERLKKLLEKSDETES